MPTVADILKESGFSTEEIAALDGRAITAFSNVLSTAEAAKQANADFYDSQIVPALTSWEEEKLRLENNAARVAAEAAFYKTQAEQARGAGFIPSDAPTFQPQRDQGGRYVANAPGGTPGSPTFFDVSKVYEKAGDAVNIILDIQSEHQRLFGVPLPINPSQLIKEADRLRIDPRIYAEKTYNYEGKRQELAKQQQEAHDAAIRKEAATERDKYWSERGGSNPDVHMPLRNVEMAEIARAQRSGKLADPLLMSESERRQQTRQAIRSELAEAT